MEEVSIPTPEQGQVLVKMVAAAVNPSDEGELRKASKQGGNPRHTLYKQFQNNR